MLQNISDAVTYCRENLSSEIFLMVLPRAVYSALPLPATTTGSRQSFPHNILLPLCPTPFMSPDSPRFSAFHLVRKIMVRIAASIMPSIKVPVTTYLDFHRISASDEVKDLFLQRSDRTYRIPLYFVSSLFNADLSGIKDGSIKCPVVAIVSKNDPLFPYSYCSDVYDLIKAPHKEMLAFDEPYHLIFNECPDRVIGPIVDKLKQFI
jgi:pimeloyl-ACP methyl ester carboxylesterase